MSKSRCCSRRRKMSRNTSVSTSRSRRRKWISSRSRN
jgi:hypothetical protein